MSIDGVGVIRFLQHPDAHAVLLHGWMLVGLQLLFSKTEYTAVAKSIGSDIHFVFAKLAVPWPKMTANIISVNHIIRLDIKS